jgi:hypothetical protein
MLHVQVQIAHRVRGGSAMRPVPMIVADEKNLDIVATSN